MTRRNTTRGGVLAALLAFAVAALSAAGASAATEVIYNNIPAPLPGNSQSLGFEATSAAEFGGQVELSGASLKNPIVTVAMSSWTCESGGATDGTCVSAPKSGYSWPITLNIYEVGAGGSVGSKIVTLTQTFAIPYRPSASAKCAGNGGWYRAGNCFHGKLFKIRFSRLGTAKAPLTLPSKVIVSVAYNTTDHGYAPTGIPGPEDSLNVGLAEVAGASVGSDPQPNDAYYNTSYGPFYCDNGVGGTNVFRLDAGCWTEAQPLIEVKSS